MGYEPTSSLAVGGRYSAARVGCRPVRPTPGTTTSPGMTLCRSQSLLQGEHVRPHRHRVDHHQRHLESSSRVQVNHVAGLIFGIREDQPHRSRLIQSSNRDSDVRRYWLRHAEHVTFGLMSDHATETRASRERHGYKTERAYSRAVARAAAWVRAEHPDLWAELLAQARREVYEK